MMTEVGDYKLPYKIHGIIVSDSDSDSGSLTEFDEDYILYQPPPLSYDLIKDKLVKISPTAVVNVWKEHLKCTVNTKNNKKNEANIDVPVVQTKKKKKKKAKSSANDQNGLTSDSKSLFCEADGRNKENFNQQNSENKHLKHVMRTKNDKKNEANIDIIIKSKKKKKAKSMASDQNGLLCNFKSLFFDVDSTNKELNTQNGNLSQDLKFSHTKTPSNMNISEKEINSTILHQVGNNTKSKTVCRINNIPSNISLSLCRHKKKREKGTKLKRIFNNEQLNVIDKKLDKIKSKKFRSSTENETKLLKQKEKEMYENWYKHAAELASKTCQETLDKNQNIESIVEANSNVGITKKRKKKKRNKNKSREQSGTNALHNIKIEVTKKANDTQSNKYGYDLVAAYFEKPSNKHKEENLINPQQSITYMNSNNKEFIEKVDFSVDLLDNEDLGEIWRKFDQNVTTCLTTELNSKKTKKKKKKTVKSLCTAGSVNDQIVNKNITTSDIEDACCPSINYQDASCSLINHTFDMSDEQFINTEKYAELLGYVAVFEGTSREEKIVPEQYMEDDFPPLSSKAECNFDWHRYQKWKKDNKQETNTNSKKKKKIFKPFDITRSEDPLVHEDISDGDNIENYYETSYECTPRYTSQETNTNKKKKKINNPFDIKESADYLVDEDISDGDNIENYYETSSVYIPQYPSREKNTNEKKKKINNFFDIKESADYLVDDDISDGDNIENYYGISTVYIPRCPSRETNQYFDSSSFELSNEQFVNIEKYAELLSEFFDTYFEMTDDDAKSSHLNLCFQNKYVSNGNGIITEERIVAEEYIDEEFPPLSSKVECGSNSDWQRCQRWKKDVKQGTNTNNKKKKKIFKPFVITESVDHLVDEDISEGGNIEDQHTTLFNQSFDLDRNIIQLQEETEGCEKNLKTTYYDTNLEVTVKNNETSQNVDQNSNITAQNEVVQEKNLAYTEPIPFISKGAIKKLNENTSKRKKKKFKPFEIQTQSVEDLDYVLTRNEDIKISHTSSTQKETKYHDNYVNVTTNCDTNLQRSFKTICVDEFQRVNITSQNQISMKEEVLDFAKPVTYANYISKDSPALNQYAEVSKDVAESKDDGTITQKEYCKENVVSTTEPITSSNEIATMKKKKSNLVLETKLVNKYIAKTDKMESTYNNTNLEVVEGRNNVLLNVYPQASSNVVVSTQYDTENVVDAEELIASNTVNENSSKKKKNKKKKKKKSNTLLECVDAKIVSTCTINEDIIKKKGKKSKSLQLMYVTTVPSKDASAPAANSHNSVDNVQINADKNFEQHTFNGVNSNQDRNIDLTESDNNIVTTTYVHDLKSPDQNKYKKEELVVELEQTTCPSKDSIALKDHNVTAVYENIVYDNIFGEDFKDFLQDINLDKSTDTMCSLGDFNYEQIYLAYKIYQDKKSDKKNAEVDKSKLIGESGISRINVSGNKDHSHSLSYLSSDVTYYDTNLEVTVKSNETSQNVYQYSNITAQNEVVQEENLVYTEPIPFIPKGAIRKLNENTSKRKKKKFKPFEIQTQSVEDLDNVLSRNEDIKTSHTSNTQKETKYHDNYLNVPTNCDTNLQRSFKTICVDEFQRVNITSQNQISMKEEVLDFAKPVLYANYISKDSLALNQYAEVSKDVAESKDDGTITQKAKTDKIESANNNTNLEVVEDRNNVLLNVYPQASSNVVVSTQYDTENVVAAEELIASNTVNDNSSKKKKNKKKKKKKRNTLLECVDAKIVSTYTINEDTIKKKGKKSKSLQSMYITAVPIKDASAPAANSHTSVNNVQVNADENFEQHTFNGINSNQDRNIDLTESDNNIVTTIYVHDGKIPNQNKYTKEELVNDLEQTTFTAKDSIELKDHNVTAVYENIVEDNIFGEDFKDFLQAINLDQSTDIMCTLGDFNYEQIYLAYKIYQDKRRKKKKKKNAKVDISKLIGESGISWTNVSGKEKHSHSLSYLSSDVTYYDTNLEVTVKSNETSQNVHQYNNITAQNEIVHEENLAFTEPIPFIPKGAIRKLNENTSKRKKKKFKPFEIQTQSVEDLDNVLSRNEDIKTSHTSNTQKETKYHDNYVNVTTNCDTNLQRSFKTICVDEFQRVNITSQNQISMKEEVLDFAKPVLYANYISKDSPALNQYAEVSKDVAESKDDGTITQKEYCKENVISTTKPIISSNEIAIKKKKKSNLVLETKLVNKYIAKTDKMESTNNNTNLEVVEDRNNVLLNVYPQASSNVVVSTQYDTENVVDAEELIASNTVNENSSKKKKNKKKKKKKSNTLLECVDAKIVSTYTINEDIITKKGKESKSLQSMYVTTVPSKDASASTANSHTSVDNVQVNADENFEQHTFNGINSNQDRNIDLTESDNNIVTTIYVHDLKSPDQSKYKKEELVVELEQTTCTAKDSIALKDHNVTAVYENIVYDNIFGEDFQDFLQDINLDESTDIMCSLGDFNYEQIYLAYKIYQDKKSDKKNAEVDKSKLIGESGISRTNVSGNEEHSHFLSYLSSDVKIHYYEFEGKNFEYFMNFRELYFSKSLDAVAKGKKSTVKKAEGSVNKEIQELIILKDEIRCHYYDFEGKNFHSFMEFRERYLCSSIDHAAQPKKELKIASIMQAANIVGNNSSHLHQYLQESDWKKFTPDNNFTVFSGALHSLRYLNNDLKIHYYEFEGKNFEYFMNFRELYFSTSLDAVAKGEKNTVKKAKSSVNKEIQGLEILKDEIRCHYYDFEGKNFHRYMEFRERYLCSSVEDTTQPETEPKIAGIAQATNIVTNNFFHLHQYLQESNWEKLTNANNFTVFIRVLHVAFIFFMFYITNIFIKSLFDNVIYICLFFVLYFIISFDRSL